MVYFDKLIAPSKKLEGSKNAERSRLAKRGTELHIETRQCPYCKIINGPMPEFCNSYRRSLN